MLNYQPSRDEVENVVRMLCDHYPSCFFENPKHRRPLKKDIAIDLIKDENFKVEPDMIRAAVDWYKSHIGYKIAKSTAGVKRIDLKGKSVGTITKSEALYAQQEVARINKSIIAKRSPTVEVAELNNRKIPSGGTTDEGVKKLDATIPRSNKAAPIAPEFTQLHDTFGSANAAVISVSDPAMRLAVAKATLDEVIKRAQQVKDELAK